MSIKHNTCIGVLLAGLLFTSYGFWNATNTTEQIKVLLVETKNTLVEVQDDLKQKSIEIANLRDVIVKKDDDLKAKKVVIEKQKNQINKKDEINRKLDAENDELERKLKKAEAQVNFKKRMRGSDVVISKSSTNKPNVSKVSSKVSSGNSIGSFIMTSYVATCQGCTGITSTGINIKNITTYQGHRIIATDPSVIPLYSIVRIHTKSGSFTAISLDKGGAIKGHKIDFLVGSEREAYSNGNMSVSIEMIRRGE